MAGTSFHCVHSILYLFSCFDMIADAGGSDLIAWDEVSTGMHTRTGACLRSLADAVCAATRGDDPYDF